MSLYPFPPRRERPPPVPPKSPALPQLNCDVGQISRSKRSVSCLSLVRGLSVADSHSWDTREAFLLSHIEEQHTRTRTRTRTRKSLPRPLTTALSRRPQSTMEQALPQLHKRAPNWRLPFSDVQHPQRRSSPPGLRVPGKGQRMFGRLGGKAQVVLL